MNAPALAPVTQQPAVATMPPQQAPVASGANIAAAATVTQSTDAANKALHAAPQTQTTTAVNPQTKLTTTVMDLITNTAGKEAASAAAPMLAKIIEALTEFVTSLFKPAEQAKDVEVKAEIPATQTSSSTTGAQAVNVAVQPDGKAEVKAAETQTANSGGGFWGLLKNVFLGGANKAATDTAA